MPSDIPRMPAEWEPHTRTFMAWPQTKVWGTDTEAVRGDIAAIAQAIAEYEPVTMLAESSQVTSAARACGSGVGVAPIPVDDLWVRDSGPTFITTAGELIGVDFGFNGWGGKQEHDRDRSVARRLLNWITVRRVEASMVAEGGAIEVDGAGTLLATESSLVNANRNPGRSRADIEARLSATLGVSTVIWLPGIAGADITDHHIDALARFTPLGPIVLNRPSAKAARKWQRDYARVHSILAAAIDAGGNGIEIVDIPEPEAIGKRGKDFLGSYLNFYVVNGSVILPRFGDKLADDRAAGIVGDLYPGRRIVQVAIDMLAEGGGGIHCATQHQPLL